MVWVFSWFGRKKRKQFYEDLKNPDAKHKRDHEHALNEWARAQLNNDNSAARDAAIKLAAIEEKRKRNK